MKKNLKELFPGGPDVEISAITADSRKVTAGTLFAALPGTVMDGRDFIEKAVAAGAVAVLAPVGAAAPVPVVEAAEPRLALARIAAAFYEKQPDVVIGITGTNGKTSVARFTQQLLSAGGLTAGTLGTLGAFAPGFEYALRHTTPDPVEIHQVLSAMATMGTTHLAMEVSSHGLSQFRADAVHFNAGAFTNITQDHLDYHETFEAYFNAKMRLFTELVPEGQPVVINMDGPGSPECAEVVRQAGREVVSVGRAGTDLRLSALKATQRGLRINIERPDGSAWETELELIGAFQADNAMVAAGLALKQGLPLDGVMAALAGLSPAPGRMQLAGRRAFSGKDMAAVYIDFAHTPDAIQTAINAMKPHTDAKIHIVFGAGGDRDATKRPLMAQAARDAGAARIIVTDDNPRSEDPSLIRQQVLSGAPGLAEEIGDREEAIRAGIEGLGAGDVLLVAGKGHEQGQTIDGVTYPFDDVEVAAKHLAEVNG